MYYLIIQYAQRVLWFPNQRLLHSSCVTQCLLSIPYHLSFLLPAQPELGQHCQLTEQRWILPFPALTANESYVHKGEDAARKWFFLRVLFCRHLGGKCAVDQMVQSNALHQICRPGPWGNPSSCPSQLSLPSCATTSSLGLAQAFVESLQTSFELMQGTRGGA